MNSSRTNKNAPKDIFQDYDIVYVVEETVNWVAEKLGFEYYAEEGKAARAFLEHVRNLPQDALEIY